MDRKSPPRGASRRLAVYDPASLSPYGLELAAQLASQGYDVRWYTIPASERPADAEVGGGATGGVAVAGVVRVDALSDRLGGRRLPSRTLVNRIVGPLRFFLRALGPRRAVVVWIRDPWDALLVLLLGLLGRRPYVVHHNPRQARTPRGGLVGRLERAALPRSVVCVHSEAMADMAREDYPEVRVTPHPNFTLTAGRAPERDPLARTVVFIGSLRADKGADVLVDVLTRSGGDFTFQTVGRGRLGDQQIRALAGAGIGYESVGGDEGVSDAELLRRLSRATVVLAPYTQPTESGTALLAMAAGAPLLGVARGALCRVLNPRSRAVDETELAELLGEFLRAPWPTWAITEQDQDATARQGWSTALETP